MAIRYSGDAEIRLSYDDTTRSYKGTISDPWLRFRGEVPVSPRYARNPRSSEAYDDAAKRLAYLGHRWARTRSKRRPRRPSGFAFDTAGRRIRFRRGFQSPCPID